MTTPTDYRVDFGAHLEHHAYFRDRAKAEQYAANSHGRVVALFEKEPTNGQTSTAVAVAPARAGGD
jgi:nitrous oxide reductase accessory protein NosL